MNGLRLEFQDRVNFVILDWSIRADRTFARSLDLTYHPNYASIAPNSDEVVRGLYLEARGNELSDMVEQLVADYAE